MEFGLPGSLWLAAQRTGVFELLQSLWPASRSGPSPAHYLLLAAIHRICQPGPKTEVADWYDRTILRSQWGFAPRAVYLARVLGLLRFGRRGPGALPGPDPFEIGLRLANKMKSLKDPQSGKSTSSNIR